MFARHHIYILNSAIVVQCVCVCVLCVCSFVYIHVCAMYTGKERLDVFEAKIEESEKAGSIYRELEGWWLSGCRSAVTEHWLHKPGVLGSIFCGCQPFHFPLF